MALARIATRQIVATASTTRLLSFKRFATATGQERQNHRLNYPRSSRAAHEHYEEESQKTTDVQKRDTPSGKHHGSRQHHHSPAGVFLREDALPIVMVTGRGVETQLRETHREYDGPDGEGHHCHPKYGELTAHGKTHREIKPEESGQPKRQRMANGKKRKLGPDRRCHDKHDQRQRPLHRAKPAKDASGMAQEEEGDSSVDNELRDDSTIKSKSRGGSMRRLKRLVGRDKRDRPLHGKKCKNRRASKIFKAYPAHRSPVPGSVSHIDQRRAGRGDD